MKKLYTILSLTAFLVVSNNASALLGDAFNTVGNAVKGSVNTATGVVTDVAEGNVLEMPGNTVARAVNTGAGAVTDTGKTVTNVFDGGENPVESEPLDYTDTDPVLSTYESQPSATVERTYYAEEYSDDE